MDLEDDFNNVGLMELDMSWDFDDDSNKKRAHNSFDALIYSINDKGMIDLEYMEEISNIPMKQLIEELKEYMFQDPMYWEMCWYKGFKTKDEYLSGNIFQKIITAEQANLDNNGLFDRNIEALKKILPKGVTYNEIYYSIGSSWIDPELIKDFIVDVFGSSLPRRMIVYVKETSTWIINSSIEFYNTANYTFGTNRLGTKKILLSLLNHCEISVYDALIVDGKEKRVFNKDETILALEKAELLERAFKTYVINHQLEKRIAECYNTKYCNYISRKYDGSYLKLPKLYDYQKDAVARILYNKNTLLAHNVGAGKTYVMITAGEELLRLGYSTKNLYVVPNSILGQWKDMYNKLYPNNNMLVIYPEDFTIHTMEKILTEIKDGKYNTIMTAFSVFDRFKHSKEVQIKQLNERIEELKNLHVVGWIRNHHLNSQIKELNNKVEKLMLEPDDDVLTFEELGITRLFLDEAHNYKNIPIITKINHLNGISATGSTKCVSMLHATDYINSLPNGGIIMATGTPITNSVTDIYAFQRYLQNGQLKLLNIDSFDKWISVFAETVDEIEIDVDAVNYRLQSRISKFYNIEQLTSILANISDFYNPNMQKSLPQLKGYTDIVLNKNSDINEYIKNISKRVELIRNNLIERKVDNLLKVTIDGRKAALDLRLVKDVVASPINKVNYCASEVFKIYSNYPKTTQIIFCDYSVPKDGFNIYDELKRLLISYGVKEEEIDFIHNANTDAKKNKMLELVRRGKIRVIIGSTIKLGTGVNIQDKLIAIHHLDVPWRPADIMQREGRIMREGNTNREVFIFRYIQEGSFDAYSWQILERKAKLIKDILADSLSEKEAEDIEDVVLSYAEIKSLAVGDNRIKEHIELVNKRNRILALAKKQNERYESLFNEIDILKGKIIDLEEVNHLIQLDRYKTASINTVENEKEFDLVKNNLEQYFGKDEETLVYKFYDFEILVPPYFFTKNKYYLIKGAYTYKVRCNDKKDFNLITIIQTIGSFSLVNSNKVSISEMQNAILCIQDELNNKIDFNTELEVLNKKIELLEEELKIHE